MAAIPPPPLLRLPPLPPPLRPHLLLLSSASQSSVCSPLPPPPDSPVCALRDYAEQLSSSSSSAMRDGGVRRRPPRPLSPSPREVADASLPPFSATVHMEAEPLDPPATRAKSLPSSPLLLLCAALWLLTLLTTTVTALTSNVLVSTSAAASLDERGQLQWTAAVHSATCSALTHPLPLSPSLLRAPYRALHCFCLAWAELLGSLQWMAAANCAVGVLRAVREGRRGRSWWHFTARLVLLSALGLAAPASREEASEGKATAKRQ